MAIKVKTSPIEQVKKLVAIVSRAREFGWASKTSDECFEFLFETIEYFSAQRITDISLLRRSIVHVMETEFPNDLEFIPKERAFRSWARPLINSEKSLTTPQNRTQSEQEKKPNTRRPKA